MIQVTPHMRIIVACDPVDFRKGIDGLAAVCLQKLSMDPFSGALFVFVNKSRQAIRILVYDGQGFWMCHKRLSQGRFAWNFSSNERLAARQLQQLLWNGDAADFRRIPENLIKP